MAGSFFKNVASLLIALFALGYVLPDRAHVERDVVIDAPPEKIFALISDLKSWKEWAPLSSIAPQADDHLNGAGQAFEIQSAHLLPARFTQEIVAAAEPARLVTRTRLAGLGETDSAFTLLPDEDGAVRVVWSLDSNLRDHAPFLLKPFWTYASYFAEPALGPASERSLAKLKRVAEAG
ncbi:SRPBCC family protein [Hyphococcus luteus]|nr:SRPBCC family protein [Marinicaulis flavus]